MKDFELKDVYLVPAGARAAFPYSPADHVYKTEKITFQPVVVGDVLLFIAYSKKTNQVAIHKTAALLGG